MDTLLASIGLGERFIFALARPATVPIAHTVDAGDVSWVFAVAEPTGTRADDHTVDAGDAAFSFALPEPTIQRGRARNAGDVSWSFALPQPSIFAAGSHFIDAGDVAFAFVLPQPSVTVDHTVNAGDAAWAFSLPQPAIFTAGSRFVDVGDVAWIFAVAQPSVARGVHADAGDVSFAFAVPQPTVTKTSSHAVDAGNVSWVFAVAEPTVAYRPMMAFRVNAGAVRWHFRVLDADHYTIPALPMMAAPIPVTDRIIALDDLLDLLISQYTGNAPINALLRGMYGLIDAELVQALKDLERMRNWDTAEGVWLNYIGRRLGMERPSIDTVVTRLGFDGGDGVGFNQAPFATATGFVPQVAVSDAVYLLCLKVWAGTILTSGTIPDMNAAVQRSFPNAYYTTARTAPLRWFPGPAERSRPSPGTS